MMDELLKKWEYNKGYYEGYDEGRADKYHEIVSEYMLLTEEQVKQIREDAIEEYKKKIEFVEEWLFDVCKICEPNVTVAFETLKHYSEHI